MDVLKPTIALTFALLLLAVCIQGERAGIQDLLDREAQPVVTSNISSTAAGGVWSSPAAWTGGIVPTAADDVTILGGATVIIDTAAAAKSVTVGGSGSISGVKSIFAEGSQPASLTFGETGAFSLTVTGDVTIGSNSSLTTGGGNGNQHVLTVGGNLTNNGVLDLSTNNNMAAAMLVFTGASNTTFGGSGPVTDISWITVEKGTTSANILELSAANFSVRGSTADTPDSGFLFLNHGTFKISGTFTLSNRTFFNAAYEITNDAGFWLNNPNYTIVAQHQAEVAVWGTLRVSAGTYNIGTDLGDSLVYRPGSTVIVEGGEINTAGRFAIKSDGSVLTTYTQTGGTVTTCKVGFEPGFGTSCFDAGSYITRFNFNIVAGDIVIQNGTLICCQYAYYYAGYSDILFSGTTIRFGNSETGGPKTYNVGGNLPNVVIDTTGGNHTVLGYGTRLHNLEIQPGGIWDSQDDYLMIFGETFVNNGKLRVHSTSYYSSLAFMGSHPTYSGQGTIDGLVNDLALRCITLTMDSANGIRARHISFNSSFLINSGQVTLGNNDDIESSVGFFDSGATPGGFDGPPVFDLGTGGQFVTYGSRFTRTTGFEINPDRKLKTLNLYSPSQPPCAVTLAGGDLTVTNLFLSFGTLCTGSNKIIHKEGWNMRDGGYIDGTVVRSFTAPGTYTFLVGKNGYSPVTLNVSALGVNPSYLSVKPVDTILPGLLPANSASRYWQLEETGDLTAGLVFGYTDADVRGSEPNYALWRSTGGPPVMIGGSVPLPNSNTVSSPAGITDFTGNWGVGAQLDPGPVSISGSVTTSGGQPIRNATLTISGGNLPSPMTVQTGNFGTYSFTNLQAGETYTVRVDVKRYRFAQPTQLVTPMSNVSNVNFVANPSD
jgi:hypothetical protein